MDLQLDIKEIFTAFMVLFAVIDITGSTPIIINLNATGKHVQSGKAALISYVVMIVFFICGRCSSATFQCRHFFVCYCRSHGAFGFGYRDDF